MHREELASYLRSRRDRLSPAEVGITPLTHRRTPGLRRAEVAERAGVSVTWYTWLEQARRIRVSRQVLTSLARALLLDPSESAHLFELAGEIQPREVVVEPPTEVNSTACLRLLERLNPFPAVLINRRWDVLAANDAYAVLVPFYSALPTERRNLLSMMFEPEAKQLFLDWEAEASGTLASFRARAGRGVVESDFAELIDRLQQTRSDFAELWCRHDVTATASFTHALVHPRLGRIELVSIQLITPAQDTMMVVYQPGPDERGLTDRLRAVLAEDCRPRQAASRPIARLGTA